MSDSKTIQDTLRSTKDTLLDTKDKVQKSVQGAPQKVQETVQNLSTGQKVAAAAVGVAAAAAAGIAAIRTARAKVQKGTKPVYHLVPETEGWKLTLEGADHAKAHFSTKQEGLDAARALAHEEAPSELVIHREDGTVQDRHSYGE